MKLEVLPLTREAFRPYGDVIETEGQDFFHINDGKVQRFHDLAMVETLQQDRTLISINRAQPAVLPIVVTELERHPLGTQAFVPMNGEAFVVVVAAGHDHAARVYLQWPPGGKLSSQCLASPAVCLAERNRFFNRRSRWKR